MFMSRSQETSATGIDMPQTKHIRIGISRQYIDNITNA
jgi:hypothetical protein